MGERDKLRRWLPSVRETRKTAERDIKMQSDKPAKNKRWVVNFSDLDSQITLPSVKIKSRTAQEDAWGVQDLLLSKRYGCMIEQREH